MYHPTRGGVRGGRDQFSWDDVKVDKHRENYIGHSIKAAVGRWQKGKDLHWYTRDKKSQDKDLEAAKEEIRRIKEEEEQSMREALGLAPKRATRPQGTRLDKHELSELVKRGSTAEDLGAGHSEAARVDGLGFSNCQALGRNKFTISFSIYPIDEPVEKINASLPVAPLQNEEESEDERSQKKKRREEKRREKDERRDKRHLHDTNDRRKHSRDSDDRRKRSRDSDDKRKHTRDSDDRKKHKKDKEKRRRHDSDSD